MKFQQKVLDKFEADGIAEGERLATAAIVADLRAQADRREMEDFGHPGGIPLWLAERYASGDHLAAQINQGE